jgi:hypothetical protein
MAGGCGGGSSSGGGYSPPSGGGTLTVAPSNLSLSVGQTETLTVANARGALAWRSANTSVARVGYGNSLTNTVTANGTFKPTAEDLKPYMPNPGILDWTRFDVEGNQWWGGFILDGKSSRVKNGLKGRAKSIGLYGDKNLSVPYVDQDIVWMRLLF